MMAEGMLPPDSAPAKILKDLDFEISPTENGVSLGIKVKDDCDNFFVLSLLSVMDAYYHRLHQSLHLGVELKHDLSFFK